MQISIARDFSITPGPRTRVEGDFSGEQFLEEVLLPRFDEAVQKGETLTIDLDGTEGYATSFLEAAFGGLARVRELDVVKRTLRFKSEDEPFLTEEIQQYISEARE